MLALAHKYLVFLPLTLLCLAIRPDALNLNPPADRMATLPPRTLWVWERPENLRSIDPKATAVATLDGTLLLGARITRRIDVRSSPFRSPHSPGGYCASNEMLSRFC